MNNKILQEFRTIVMNNGKIISARLNERYFTNIDKLDIWNEWNELTSNLKNEYKKLSDRILASEESLDISLCTHCNTKPRIIVCDEKNNHKRILSKWCSVKCSAKSYEKVSKFKETISSRTDVDWNITKEKKAETMLEKYGYAYNLQRPDVRENHKQKNGLSGDILAKLTDQNWVQENYINQKKSLSVIGYELGIYYGTVGEYVRKLGFEIHYEYSKFLEQEIIKDYLNLIGVKYIQSDRKLIAPKELDFYLPDYNIAIEIDGIYWHSDKFKENENNQVIKTEMCDTIGIRLIHFTCKQVKDKLELVQSIIDSALKFTKKIHARKCKVVKMDDKKVVKEFMDKNHMQKYIHGDIVYGLIYNDELVAVMSFGKPRFAKSHEWELYRFCSKLNTTVVGGASKLLKAFETDNLPTSLISYCNRMRSNGNLYTKLEFNLMHKSKPSYYWVKDGKMYSRYSCYKKNLPNIIGDKFDETLTEEVNMSNAGFFKFWDCGNLVFEKSYNV